MVGILEIIQLTNKKLLISEGIRNATAPDLFEFGSLKSSLGILKIDTDKGT